jgi:hypothetical protein
MTRMMTWLSMSAQGLNWLDLESSRMKMVVFIVQGRIELSLIVQGCIWIFHQNDSKYLSLETNTILAFHLCPCPQLLPDLGLESGAAPERIYPQDASSLCPSKFEAQSRSAPVSPLPSVFDPFHISFLRQIKEGRSHSNPTFRPNMWRVGAIPKIRVGSTPLRSRRSPTKHTMEGLGREATSYGISSLEYFTRAKW